MSVGAVVVAAAAILIAVVVALCAHGVIGRNSALGLRIPSLLASESAWSAGHRAAVSPVFAAAACDVVVAVAVVIAPDASTAGITVELVILVAGALIGAVRGSRAARRAE